MRRKALKLIVTNEWVSSIEENGDLCTGETPHLFPMTMTLENFAEYWQKHNVTIDISAYKLEIINISPEVDFSLERTEVIKRLLEYNKEVHYSLFTGVIVDYHDINGEHTSVLSDVYETEFCSIFAVCPFLQEIYINELDGDNIRIKKFEDFTNDKTLISCLMLLDSGLYSEEEAEYKIVHNKN